MLMRIEKSWSIALHNKIVFKSFLNTSSHKFYLNLREPDCSRMSELTEQRFISFQTFSDISHWLCSISVIHLLVILASSLILTCHSQIKSTSCVNLSFSCQRHPSYSSSPSSFCSYTALSNSLISTFSSKVDYCNSLYNGISQKNLNKIQRIQNTLARVVTNTSKFEHITSILKNDIGFQSNNGRTTNLCLRRYKTLQIQQPTC